MAPKDDINSNLPVGWAAAKLEDLCTPPQYGWTTSAEKDRIGLKLLRTTDISSGSVNWSTVPGCAEEPNDRSKYLLVPGDILVSRAGSVGLSYLVKNCPAAIFASYLIRFQPKPPLESAFIALYLRSPRYWAAIADETAGIAIPNVNATKLKQLEMLLPPLAEQKRIVAKVDELLTRVNATRGGLTRAALILKRFRQAVLAAACSGRLTADWRENQKGLEDHRGHFRNVLSEEQSSWNSNQFAKKRLTRVVFKGNKRRSRYEELILSGTGELPELPDGWFWATVAQLASPEPGSIQSGPFGSNLHHSEFQRTGILAIGIDNVLDGKFTPGREHRISSPKYQELVKYAARPLDVLLTVMATVGRCCVLPEDIETAIITKHVYRITVDRTLIRPHYLMFALRGDITVQEHIQNQIRGQTRPGINGQVLKGIPIPTPPILEQREIIRRVESVFKLADSIEKRVAAATVRAEKLTQSILAKAFRGELVPTEAELARREGRPYQPASALLARIQAERQEKKGR